MSNEQILIEALKNIQSYDHNGDGICPYGCDTPNIAKKALVDYGNAEYKASQQTVEADGLYRCSECNGRILKPGHCYNEFCSKPPVA